MARKVIDIGSVGNDGTGDSIRDSFRKVNDNFRELYSSLGLGERLTFIALDDTPATYVGQENAVLAVNRTTDGLKFKQIAAGTGIVIDNITNESEIRISTQFSEISGDPSPQLGGDLSARSGGNQWRIEDLTTPVSADEAANKGYTDTKISKAGVDAIDPATGLKNPSFGRMTGPLILSRNPEPEDDTIYGGLVAATKAYVDNSSFGSVTNLYVALSGQDDRPGVSPALQGRALAYAFRTLEAALKKAEEIQLESRQELGPYQKLLTFNNGTGTCTLTDIDSSPLSGAGFAATVKMSVDTITANNNGVNYNVGDRLTLSGGTVASGGGPAVIEVLSTATTPGAIVTFRVVSTGVYTALPGSTGVTTTTDSAFGSGATFNVTYKVNSVAITNGGTGYSLVSVRITGGGGTGAFGTAVVSGGVIASIVIDDQGSGFTTLPTIVADLPRFLIRTDNYRTDFTGDVLTNTPTAYRGRDIREGLFLKGVNSGALAQILSHSGALDSGGNEIFDCDIKYGAFELGEPIMYGDAARSTQVTILVESGIYEENYPLRVPQNTSIVGDEFRRVIIRPRQGTSSSPWAFMKFRRDLTNDGLTTATQEFGYHYLQNSSQPVYPKVDNKGAYKLAAALLTLNRQFLAEETVAWIDDQITAGTAPFTTTFTYNSRTCKRDAGLIIDALIFDLKWGGYNRTISAALKYYQNASGLIAITTQLSQTLAAVDRLNVMARQVVNNVAVTRNQTDYEQIIDSAYIAESGSIDVIDDLFAALKDVMDGSGSVNYPKENDQMDVFLANDAVRWQAITAQGHGGFMCVLDPEGQILAKSPYAQECASFSKSIDAQTFAGGIFVDGFAGNLEFKITSVISPTRLEVTGLDRYPQLPCSFIYLDTVYRINYIRDFVYNKDGSTATFVLDETTQWPYSVFTYNESICNRDVGLIIDGLGYDVVFQTNYHARKSGSTYRLANAEVVIDSQKDLTVRAITYAHELARAAVSDTTSQNTVDNSSTIITKIVNRGLVYSPTLILTNPPGLSTNLANAKTLLLANVDYIKDETVAWINAQIAGNIAPFTTAFVYDSITCARDVGFICEAVAYDLIYGGNSQTRDAGLKYYDGVGSAITNQIVGQVSETAAALDYTKYLIKQVIQNLAPATSYSTTPRVTGTGATATEAATVETLMSNLVATVSGGVGSAPSETLPNLSAYSYTAALVTARTALQTNKSTIQTQTIGFVNTNANRFEILMPGNRSILGNDFTQVNDMGYGIFATNGALVEAVSMFTYYCYTSYYSLNGAQIRSVAGSSAHGVYALVAEGSDPLEVSTPTTMYFDMAQRVDCYYPSPSFANTTGGLFIYVNNYDYEPLNNSELEVDHGNLIYRYPVTSVTTADLPAGVARLNLTSDTTGNFDGLYASVSNGTKMSIRANSQIILTGGLQDVAVRPSTGLRLAESDDVYRVLQFEEYTDTTNEPYGVLFTAGSPGTVSLTTTVTTISTNVCTTNTNHRLKIGDKFIPTSTANGFTAGTTYYIISIPAYNQFTVSTSPTGSVSVLTNGTGLTIVGRRTHRFLEKFTVSFTTTGTLPTGYSVGTTYYVISDGLTNTDFRLSATDNGAPIVIPSAGSGTHRLFLEGLTKTTLRENYNYIDLTYYQPGEYVGGTTATCTISIASPAVITRSSHGFVAGDVIRFTTDGGLPTGISLNKNYFVISAGLGLNSFRVSEAPGGTAVDTSGVQSGTHTVGKVTGRAGDTNFAVVALSPSDTARADGAKFVFRGEEYTISNYENETDTGQPYGRVNLNRALVDPINAYQNSHTIKAAVPIRSDGADGTLTIRISLTRVTGHDLLEIGTGSYADTNYPNEIYGPPVNAVNDANETEERDVGRVFYVTTDQFGNFRVGPYFAVDQGTGRVSFSAAIALSNLDGIGFKRGVPISEFSTDSGMTDNATDTVPTENATRTYIDRRLGLSHGGSPVVGTNLIPPVSGGFMALDGQLAMKGVMDLGNNKIINLSNPTNPQDAVNLRSLTFNNLQEFSVTNVQAADVIAFTGAGNSAINARVTGDITFDLRPGVDSALNQLDAQINAGAILNADINASAAIDQSKLNMTAASTRGNATGITQADRGLASFDSNQFNATNGWISVKDNGLLASKIEQISTKTVLGNSTLSTGNVSAVAFTTVINDGGAVKKTQYSSSGFLRRTGGTGASDGDYTVIDAAAGSSSSVEASKLIVRDTNGDFGARTADLQSIKIDTNLAIDTATAGSGGYIRFYGYNTQGGILVSDGTLAIDKKTAYWNDSHQFKTQNGVSDAPITCSSIQTLALTTGGNTTSGTITGRWTLTGTSPNESRLQATYSADLAEYYEGDKEYDVGTVLVFGGDKEVTTSNIKGDTRVAGVVSNTAAFVMYDACPGFKNLVALQGRVPCRVAGKIKKGDLLITSSIAGVAIAAVGDVKVGTVVGKALQNYDSDHIGTIEIAVGRT